MEETTTFRDWAGLPGDLLTCIGELLDLSGGLCFRGVCRSWSAALPALMPSPWLVIPDGPDIGDRDRFTMLSLPTLSPMRWRLEHQRCVGSSDGWLALVDPCLAITLLNPLTDAEPAVRLPPLGPFRRESFRGRCISHFVPMSPDGTLRILTPRDRRIFESAQLSFIHRVAFGPNPTAQDYAVAVLCRDGHGMAFTTAGGGGWQWLAWPDAAGRAATPAVVYQGSEPVYVNRDLDLVYHGGKFYYTTLCGTVWALDPAAAPPVAPVPFAKLRPPGPDHRHYGKHLVFAGDENDGALHVVWSDVPGLHDATRGRTRRMCVRRYDPAATRARRWRKVRHLGGRAFLIGGRSQSVAVSVPASSSPSTWLRPNCVYFTDITPGSDDVSMWEYLPEPEIWEFDVVANSFRACHRGGEELEWLDWLKAIWFTPRVRRGSTTTNQIVPFSQDLPDFFYLK
ncbi:unnamed protein product [Urochloa decumbens]|uniref:KIB1-4 beta-propeller domain-containing protein n=1 Tax=Urochloa decumbens TaxID=240449 RepID=A0ABC8YL76_9POAL